MSSAITWTNQRVSITKDLVFGLCVLGLTGWVPLTQLTNEEKKQILDLVDYDETPWGQELTEALALTTGDAVEDEPAAAVKIPVVLSVQTAHALDTSTDEFKASIQAKDRADVTLSILKELTVTPYGGMQADLKYAIVTKTDMGWRLFRTADQTLVAEGTIETVITALLRIWG